MQEFNIRQQPTRRQIRQIKLSVDNEWRLYEPTKEKYRWWFSHWLDGKPRKRLSKSEKARIEDAERNGAKVAYIERGTNRLIVKSTLTMP